MDLYPPPDDARRIKHLCRVVRIRVNVVQEYPAGVHGHHDICAGARPLMRGSVLPVEFVLVGRAQADYVDAFRDAGRCA